MVNASLFQPGEHKKKVNKYLHLSLMKKLRYNNISLIEVAKSGSIKCLKYAHEIIGATDVDNNTLYNAARSGSLACLKYARIFFTSKCFKN
jgi:hypothetical protein